VFIRYSLTATRRNQSTYMEGEGGGWMAFQHLFDGSVSFMRNWEEYKEGFGDSGGEHWLGNELLHQLS